MASKFGMAGGMPERKVRPIWDAIDTRQYKNALKLSSTLLSKHPNSPYALALKALILERMGKTEEALSVCLSAKDLLHKNDSLLMDDLTLSTLQIVFQRLDHLDLATSCYEYACGKFTNNLELMMGLFNCYVREYSFVKQQQTAIKMYKIAGEERFLLWAVCSFQLQVLCGNGGQKLLLLAEGLLKKHIASHSLHEPEALIVYIAILQQQSKHGDALEILSGKLGSLFMIEVDKLRLQGKLLAQAGNFVDAASIFQKVFESCPDDWECFLDYLGCLLEDDSRWCSDESNEPIHRPKHVKCKFSQLTDEVFDSQITVASTFVHKLQAEANSDFVRCPYLANLEIERRKHLRGKENEDKLIEALIQYFVRFGHLACYASDVEVFLEVLTNEKRLLLREMLEKISEPFSPVPAKVLGKSISLFKVKESISNTFSLTVAELEGSAVEMVGMYCKNLPLSKNLDSQESMYGEELLSMACNALVQLFWRSRNVGYLFEAIMILEFGLTVRSYVSQYKVLLLHLYSHLSSLSVAYEWYKSLAVKNILLESISHHILPQMLASPLWVDLDNLLSDYLKFMDNHFRESADLTFLAYRHRNYSKVIEFVQFKERLQRSDQYLVARLETSILQLKRNADKIEEEECVLECLKLGTDFIELSSEIGGKSLTFNEDLQTRPWWTPSPGENYLLGPFEALSYRPRKNLTSEREKNVRRVVERRSMLPRMIYLSIQCASTLRKESIEVNGSITDPKVSSELKFLLERYANILGHTFTDAIEVVVRALGTQEASEAFDVDIMDWVNFAVFLNAWNINCHEVVALFEGDEGDQGTLHIVDSLLDKYIRQKVISSGSLISSPLCDFPTLVQLISESMAWHCLVVQSYVRSSLPSGKKKKKSGHVDQSSTPIFQAIRNSIQLLCGTLEEVIKWLREQINKPADENLDFILSSLQKNEQTQGPGQVFQELQDFIASKNDMELGDRISVALKSWSPINVAKKVVFGQCTVMSEFLQICESKLKVLQTLNQQMGQG